MRILSALAAVACIVAGCGSSTTEASQDCGASGAAANVTATSSPSFAASSVTISAGQSVCWKNTSNLNHTVTSNTAGLFDQALGQGQIFVHVFPAAGTYNYHCSIHAVMAGTVVVQ